MRTHVKTLEEIYGLSIKSKQKFDGVFDDELKKLIEGSEILIRDKIIPNYGVEYTEFGNYTVKIKINDDNLMVEKLIVCSFNYKQSDIKFGYIHPEFSSTEKGQKTRKHKLGKFNILETEQILAKFIKQLVDTIEEF